LKRFGGEFPHLVHFVWVNQQSHATVVFLEEDRSVLCNACICVEAQTGPRVVLVGKQHLHGSLPLLKGVRMLGSLIPEKSRNATALEISRPAAGPSEFAVLKPSSRFSKHPDLPRCPKLFFFVGQDGSDLFSLDVRTRRRCLLGLTFWLYFLLLTFPTSRGLAK